MLSGCSEYNYEFYSETAVLAVQAVLTIVCTTVPHDSSPCCEFVSVNFLNKTKPNTLGSTHVDLGLRWLCLVKGILFHTEEISCRFNFFKNPSFSLLRIMSTHNLAISSSATLYGRLDHLQSSLVIHHTSSICRHLGTSPNILLDRC